MLKILGLIIVSVWIFEGVKSIFQTLTSIFKGFVLLQKDKIVSIHRKRKYTNHKSAALLGFVIGYLMNGAILYGGLRLMAFTYSYSINLAAIAILAYIVIAEILAIIAVKKCIIF